MSQFTVHELDPDVRVQVTRPMPSLAPDLDRKVEVLWLRASARMARGRAGRLFNGQVFSADTISRDTITGHLTEFRRVAAQLEDERISAELGLRPLAVCGVLRCREGVVFGRRHKDAIYQGGMWQLPPAGSVDASAVAEDGAVDLRHQIRLELQEELGMEPEMVTDPVPLCLVEHPGTHVSDIGIALRTPLSAQAVLERHRRAANGEYGPLLAVPFGDLGAFVYRLGDTLVPPAREFLVRLGLLEPGDGAGHCSHMPATPGDRVDPSRPQD